MSVWCVGISWVVSIMVSLCVRVVRVFLSVVCGGIWVICVVLIGIVLLISIIVISVSIVVLKSVLKWVWDGKWCRGVGCCWFSLFMGSLCWLMGIFLIVICICLDIFFCCCVLSFILCCVLVVNVCSLIILWVLRIFVNWLLGCFLVLLSGFGIFFFFLICRLWIRWFCFVLFGVSCLCWMWCSVLCFFMLFCFWLLLVCMFCLCLLIGWLFLWIIYGFFKSKWRSLRCCMLI